MKWTSVSLVEFFVLNKSRLIIFFSFPYFNFIRNYSSIRCSRTCEFVLRIPVFCVVFILHVTSHWARSFYSFCHSFAISLFVLALTSFEFVFISMDQFASFFLNNWFSDKWNHNDIKNEKLLIWCPVLPSSGWDIVSVDNKRYDLQYVFISFKRRLMIS